MSRFPSLIPCRRAMAAWFGALLLGGLTVQFVWARPTLARNETDTATKKHAVTDAQIECITPDGRRSAVTNPGVNAPDAPALLMKNGTIRCTLHEGETTFIIPLCKLAFLDRFAFLNRNAAACGEFRISVSDSRLPASSPRWTPVHGMVPFAHKRLFSLSVLGVEAKYVKLSFHVQKAGPITGFAFNQPAVTI